VSLYDWLLFLHVAAAFALVAGIFLYGVVLLGDAGDVARRALGVPALALWNAGGQLSRDVRDVRSPLDIGGGRVRLAVMALATLLLLVDMIYKPGA
jgi:hypothetical protein